MSRYYIVYMSNIYEMKFDTIPYIELKIGFNMEIFLDSLDTYTRDVCVGRY